MPLDVNFERGGEAIRANVSITPHWREFGKTYGFECRQWNDYRNDYKLETRIRLAASGERAGRVEALSLSGNQVLVPVETFPQELIHEFIYSEDLKARIEAGNLTVFVKFVEQIPWGLTDKEKAPRVYWDVRELTSLSTLGLQFTLLAIFHPPKGRPAPIEFEWGSPRVLSGGFETNRRKH